MKQSPLHQKHLALGAKMVEFGGYAMPVSYAGTLAEHRAVREDCGIFDISHMGEIFIRGPQALDAVQYLTSNDAKTLQDHGAQYSLLLHPEGYALDDILVYRLGPEEFMLCVNAANTDQDFSWIQKHNPLSAALENSSPEMAMLALQGPKSPELLKRLGFDLFSIQRFTTRSTQLNGVKLLISRTGYTGEEGCEFFLPNEDAGTLWDILLSTGKDLGCQAIGLGARDTLRLEKAYVLYGHELSPEINPLEAGLHWVIRLEKGEFLGRDALIQSKEKGLNKKLLCLVMEEKGIPRQNMKVMNQGKAVGWVMSGTMSPSLGKGIATALIQRSSEHDVGEFFVDIRGKMKKASVVKPPFI